MKNPHSPIFIFFLAAIGATTPLSIDLALPALHQIAVTLHTSPGAAGLTLSLFMVGFAGAPLIYGPLSDRHGRRPLLAIGLGLFTLGSFCAAASPNILVLLLSRFVEGAGAGAGMSLAFAIVRDLFSGQEGRVKLSYVQMTASVAPLIAPSIGALIMGFASWRAIYGLLGVDGLVLLIVTLLALPESHAGRDASGPLLARIATGYRTLLTSRVGFGFAMVYALSFGVQFSYITGSPLVFMGRFGLSARIYGLTFACTAFGIMAGTFLNARLARHHVPAIVPLTAALGLYLATSGVMLAVIASGAASPFTILPLLVLSALAFGTIGANAAQGAMHAVPQIAGIVGGVLTSLQMGVAALAGAVVAAGFGSFGLYAMVVPMTVCGVAAASVYGLVVLRATAARPEPVAGD